MEKRGCRCLSALKGVRAVEEEISRGRKKAQRRRVRIIVRGPRQEGLAASDGRGRRLYENDVIGKKYLLIGSTTVVFLGRLAAKYSAAPDETRLYL